MLVVFAARKQRLRRRQEPSPELPTPSGSELERPGSARDVLGAEPSSQSAVPKLAALALAFVGAKARAVETVADVLKEGAIGAVACVRLAVCGEVATRTRGATATTATATATTTTATTTTATAGVNDSAGP